LAEAKDLDRETPDSSPRRADAVHRPTLPLPIACRYRPAWLAHGAASRVITAATRLSALLKAMTTQGPSSCATSYAFVHK
jgi:hypothetical protein